MSEEKHCNHHFIVPRRGLPGINGKLGNQSHVTVAFLGGSITEGAGASEADTHSWRALTGKYLQERFPNKAFTFINAGVGGTNSTLGAHRLQEHVLLQGGIDLMFVEFSVNDNESDREESIRGMEGIVRQMGRLSPETDLCFLYTAAEKNLSGSNPFNIAVHEEVAEHYGVPSVNFAGRVYKETTAGRMEWMALAPDGYHPNDDGHALYAGYLREYLDAELIPGASAAAQSSDILGLPALEEHNYEYGSLLSFRTGHGEEFELRKLAADDPLMNWRFDTEHLYTDSLEAEYSYTVTGQQAGLLLLYGPDSGIFEYSVNGSPYTAVNLFDEWCPMAFRPIIAMFPVQEQRQEIAVKVRITGQKDEQSQGTSLRIMKLLCS
ncbi:SGNH/GDSL hydrolase family protein [Paenibacillus guangzhouensis]|uniref:SGNH/GDSL hydrolase family protein n=1 Tax=Paenibacillus guangzhouensis TaxID=1473112 RepID=UPI0012669AD1|nr:SGNH/GDSL hydrolase family protein [Paenibacillus guangzhouensis]